MSRWISGDGHLLAVRPPAAPSDQCAQGATGTDPDPLPRRAAGTVRAGTTGHEAVRGSRRQDHLGADTFSSSNRPATRLRRDACDGPARRPAPPSAISNHGSICAGTGEVSRRSSRVGCAGAPTELSRRIPTAAKHQDRRGGGSRRRPGDNRPQPHRGGASAPRSRNSGTWRRYGGGHGAPATAHSISDQPLKWVRCSRTEKSVKIPDTGRNTRYQGLASVYGACAPGGFQARDFQTGPESGCDECLLHF